MDDSPEHLVAKLDPIWLEKGTDIRLCREVINCPQMRAGEGVYNDALLNTVFVAYNRLPLVYGSLIALIEYDEIFKRSGNDFFSNPENQRVVLRALGLIVESSIKLPYGDEEIKNYSDHQPFLNGYSKKLRGLDQSIERGNKPPINFVNTLLMFFQQEVNKLKGVENFSVNVEKARMAIANDLPELAKLDDGRILGEIKNRLLSAKPDAKT